MERLRIGHVGLHVRNLEETVEFLRLIGAEVTSVGQMGPKRVAFISLDGTTHHSLALFEDGARLPTGDSKKEPMGLHHIAMPCDSRATVDAYADKLRAHGYEIDGPSIQGPEDGGLAAGSRSYGIFFTDPNGINFEIFTGAMTVQEFREVEPDAETLPA